MANRHMDSLLDALCVLYGHKTRSKMLKLLIENQALIAAKIPRKTVKNNRYAAWQVCQRFAEEHEHKAEFVQQGVTS